MEDADDSSKQNVKKLTSQNHLDALVETIDPRASDEEEKIDNALDNNGPIDEEESYTSSQYTG